MKARRTIALRISAKDPRLLERMIREWIGPDDETQDDHETDRALRRVHAALRAARLDRAVDALRARAAKARTSPDRCAICDWPLHDTIDKGCTAESCSYRPEFGSEEHRRIAARRKEIAAKAGGGT